MLEAQKRPTAQCGGEGFMMDKVLRGALLHWYHLFRLLSATPFSSLSVMVSSSKALTLTGICLGTEQGPEEAVLYRSDV